MFMFRLAVITIPSRHPANAAFVQSELTATLLFMPVFKLCETVLPLIQILRNAKRDRSGLIPTTLAALSRRHREN
jgi:hypothetical protein